MLSDLSTEFEGVVPLRISQLYDDDPEWGEIFSILHRQLNVHFEGVNSRIGDNYWAQPSRDLIALLDRVDELLAVCVRAGVEIEVKAAHHR